MHIDEEDKKILNSQNGILEDIPNRGIIIINESGLYSLILRSKKVEAKLFKQWVTKDVLPSIRKHGMYATEVTIDKMLSDPDFAIKLLTQLKDEKQKRKEAEEAKDRLIHQGKLYTTTELAKELNFKSPQALNLFLKGKDVQYKVNKTWVLAARYAEEGYHSIKQMELENGTIIYDRKWTGKGRDFIVSLVNLDS